MAKHIDKQYVPYEGNEFKRVFFGPTPTEPSVNCWIGFEELVGTHSDGGTVTLSFGGNRCLYLCAPDVGGIRVFSKEEGYFVLQSRKRIFENCVSPEETVFTAEDTSVRVRSGKEWCVEIRGAEDEPVFTLNRNSLRIGSMEGKPERVCLQFPITEEEVLCGLGERFSGVNQNGNRHFFWNMDCGYHGDSKGAELWKSYKNVPLIHSDRGYSLFFNSFYPAVSDVGYTDEHICSWDFWGPTLDMYIWLGSLPERLRSYTDLTGKPFLPPKWAFRYMSGGGNGFWYGPDWGSGNIPEKYLALLEEVLAGYRRLQTPHMAALYGEGWIADNPRANEMLRDEGIRMLRWNPPDYPIDIMRELLPGVSDPELPNVKDVNDPGKIAGDYLDFFNPNVKKLLHHRLDDKFQMGLRGGMLDFAEMVPENALYRNGMTGREMHNFNPYWYTKTYGEVTKEVVGDDYLYYCRGGCAGSQQFAGVFSGDQQASFEGLRQQLQSALSLGLCGFSAWGGDLAGYEGKPDPEVFIRGIEFSAFQPLMRAHGTRTRCPWDFGKEAEQAYVKYYWLRENMQDHLYSAALEAHETGLPMMQAMVLAFPEETELKENETQYQFCDTMLVSPVITENARTQKVYFPKGKWYDLWSGKVESGERDVDAELLKCPVYLKAGTVMPLRMSAGLNWSEPFALEAETLVLAVVPAEHHTEWTLRSSVEDRKRLAVDTCGNVLTIRADSGAHWNHLLVYARVKDVCVDGRTDEWELLPNENGDGISRIRLSAMGWNEVTITIDER